MATNEYFHAAHTTFTDFVYVMYGKSFTNLHFTSQFLCKFEIKKMLLVILCITLWGPVLSILVFFIIISNLTFEAHFLLQYLDKRV